jgi:hypothetical protein
LIRSLVPAFREPTLNTGDGGRKQGQPSGLTRLVFVFHLAHRQSISPLAI